jgi:GNAT superfamily N-acetyltransferase
MEILKGSEIKNYIDNLGHFRIKIFKEYPYLYEGDMQYEREYLSRYSKSQKSIVILTQDRQGLVGVCTGIPLEDENTEFIKPFQASDIKEIFYIGEVMVRADSREKGLGTNLLATMLDFIKPPKFKTVCLYTVDRGTNHPLRPPKYKSPESLWNRFGFSKDPAKIVYFRWKDIGDATNTEKPMNVWIKNLQTPNE